ncbi:MAG: hypothetical protein D6800_12960, partial [Candidatus Zixiibacteriota bacterium]
MTRFLTRHRGLALVLAGAVLLFIAVFLGCSGTDTSPVASPQSATVKLSMADPEVQAVMAVQNAHTRELMADPDVIGTATTIGDDGKPAIMVLVTTDRAAKLSPAKLEGVPVKVVMTDRIVAMKGKPGGGGGGTKVDHKAKQTPPIQLGTSGGWAGDLANGFCCGGTLGALIQVGGQQRILSNYHVFESDITPGGNGIVAQTGDNIIQPGLIDVSCNAANAQNVATLVVTKSLPNNNVDCSSAN